MHIYATDLPSRLLSGHFLYSFIEFGASRGGGGGLERPLMSRELPKMADVKMDPRIFRSIFRPAFFLHSSRLSAASSHRVAPSHSFYLISVVSADE